MISGIAVIVGMSLLHKVNRQTMFLTGLIGVTIALGIATPTLSESPMLPYVVLSMTVLYLAFFQGAIGPMTWLTLSEMFPALLRGVGMGIAVLCLWIFNFLVGLFFPVLLDGIGLLATFFLFTAFGIGGIIFIAKYLPETRGLSLEQVEDNFKAL